uniref:Conserved oligomeric Golgi complex subunit 5 n=1 Tax=Steinernema glaseri TaxID=37863 RepID=A0A1I7ZEV8_9BILA
MPAGSGIIDQVEDYVWGKVDENEFLRGVIEDDSLNNDALLQKVEVIQDTLNAQLRKKVEANYPKLLEQVGAIEALDQMQSNFNAEMRLLFDRSEKIATEFEKVHQKLVQDVEAIENLHLMRRILADGLRCEQLVNRLMQAKGSDHLRRAEWVAELLAIRKENPSLVKVSWMRDNFMYRIDELARNVTTDTVKSLREAMTSLSASEVATCLKALVHLNARNSTIDQLVSETIADYDKTFLQLSTTATDEKKAVKQLTQIGHKLHATLEQFAMLDEEVALKMTKRLAKVITNRVQANADYAIKMVQSVLRVVSSHPDTIVAPLRDALAPLKQSILSQSLANLFTVVDNAFASPEGDESGDSFDSLQRNAVVDRVNSAMRQEVGSVAWDPNLRAEMEANVAKTLKYVGVKLEQSISLGGDSLKMTQRLTKRQMQNYALLQAASDIADAWPTQLSGPLLALIDATVKTIVTSVEETASVVLHSMHTDEERPKERGVSAYVKELCEHLRVARSHFTPIHAVLAKNNRMKHFVQHVLEQFLLQTTLRRPMTEQLEKAIARDLEYLCDNGLIAFDGRSGDGTALYDNYMEIAEFFRKSSIEKADPKHKPATLPLWVPIQLLIGESDAQLKSPHESTGWTIAEYVSWFNNHSNRERYHFYSTLLQSYNNSVIARQETEYVQNYPLILQLVEKGLNETAK